MLTTTCITAGMWTGIGIAALGMAIALAAVAAILDRPRLRRLRHAHLATHARMANDEFLRSCELPDTQRAVALGVREAVARSMKVPAATVHPSDSMEYVSQFAFDGMDLADVEMAVEERLAVRTPKAHMGTLTGLSL